MTQKLEVQVAANTAQGCVMLVATRLGESPAQTVLTLNRDETEMLIDLLISARDIMDMAAAR